MVVYTHGGGPRAAKRWTVSCAQGEIDRRESEPPAGSFSLLIIDIGSRQIAHGALISPMDAYRDTLTGQRMIDVPSYMRTRAPIDSLSRMGGRFIRRFSKQLMSLCGARGCPNSYLADVAEIG